MDKVKVLLAVVCTWLLCALSCEKNPVNEAALPPIVSGKVVDQKGYPLIGARVTIADSSVTLGDSGTFSIATTGLPQNAKIAIAKTGYKAATKDVPADGKLPTVALPVNWTADTVEAPFDVPLFYAPSGWMGDNTDIDPALTNVTNMDSLRSGDIDGRNIKFVYTPTLSSSDKGWAGVIWQYPELNFGAEKGRVVVNAKKVTFYARGLAGGEKIDFTAGNGDGIGPNFDSYSVKKTVTLTVEWQKVVLDLTGQNTSMVLSGFMWVASKPSVIGTSMVFFLDEIRYE